MRSDYDPRLARQRALREGLAVVAHGLMTPFGYLRSGHRSERKRDIRTLVFVHGFAANRANFYPLQTYLKLAGHRRQLAYNYRSAGSIESLALRLKREIDTQVKGGRIDLVCHSMGGLVARFYLQALRGDRRVDRLITLGTPHHGTHASVYLPGALVAQMRPESAFLSHLNQLPVPRGVKTTSVVGGSDVIVLPRESAAAPFGEVREHPELGHLTLLLSPAVFSDVKRALAR